MLWEVFFFFFQEVLTFFVFRWEVKEKKKKKRLLETMGCTVLLARLKSRTISLFPSLFEKLGLEPGLQFFCFILQPGLRPADWLAPHPQQQGILLFIGFSCYCPGMSFSMIVFLLPKNTIHFQKNCLYSFQSIDNCRTL